jgi:ABC-type iron transport system FetAB ATPase subunit
VNVEADEEAIVQGESDAARVLADEIISNLQSLDGIGDVTVNGVRVSDISPEELQRRNARELP